MRRTPVLALLGFALFAAALDLSCGNGGSKCCQVPPGDTSADARACDSAYFTACVHACGETDAAETTAASCTGGVFSCDDSTIPAVSCPSSGWTAHLPCGPWVSGHDCGAGCAVCADGLWTCGACGDAAAD